MQFKLKEKENILSNLREEFSISETTYIKTLKDKDLIIDNLRREMDLLRCERNENINSKFNNKFAFFNMRKAQVRKI